MLNSNPGVKMSFRDPGFEEVARSCGGEPGDKVSETDFCSR
jgi:hypothetical protein